MLKLRALISLALLLCAPAAFTQSKSNFLFVEQGYTPKDTMKKDTRKTKYSQSYNEDEYTRTRQKSNQRYDESAYGNYDEDPKYYDRRYKEQYDPRTYEQDAPVDRSYDDRYYTRERYEDDTAKKRNLDDSYYRDTDNSYRRDRRYDSEGVNDRRQTLRRSSKPQRQSDGRYYRGYYEDPYSRRPRNYRPAWEPVLLEPVKVEVWSANTAPKDMLIWMPRMYMGWNGSYYASDRSVVAQGYNEMNYIFTNYLNYGITDNLETALVPGLRYRSTPGQSEFAFADLPIYLRYTMFKQLDEPTVTGFIRLNLPTDTGDGTTYFTHGYGLQFSVPIKPVMAHVNASYNFVVENNNYKPGNYFDYGINAEYYPYDSKLNLFLEYTGQIGSDGEWHGREQIDSGIQHMELTPGLGYMIDRDTHMQFSYTRTVWGKNADVQNIFRISATLKFPKLSSSFY